MATIQGIYIALLGRPADPLGLAFFNAATSNGRNLAALGPLDSSAEYQSRFAGQTTPQIVDAIHKSLFGRSAQQQDLTAYAEAVSSGKSSISNLAIALIDSARGDDLLVLNNKLAAANAFTTAVNTQAEISGYAGEAAAKVGRGFLITVDVTIPASTTVDNAVLRASGTGEITTLASLPDKAPALPSPAIGIPDDVRAMEASLVLNEIQSTSPDFGDDAGQVGTSPTVPSWQNVSLLTDPWWAGF